MILYDRLSLLLSSLFFCIVGTFWLLGSLQEPIFYHLVGRQYHPQVNVLAFVCIMPVYGSYYAISTAAGAQRCSSTVYDLLWKYGSASCNAGSGACGFNTTCE
jgi:hypothetical protein